MPFYKLFCIAAHYPEYKHIKDLVSQSAKLLLDNGAAVRQIEFHGTRTLPQRMKRHKALHDAGDYWSMHFDTSPRILATLNERLRTDPRVVRWTMLKLGERLEDVVRAPGTTIGVDESSALSAVVNNSRDAGKPNDAFAGIVGLDQSAAFSKMSYEVYSGKTTRR